MSSDGVKHYTDAAKRAMDWHSEKKKEIKKQRFDTIAVHRVYSMQEALDFNQGSIIEPIYMSTSQSYRDSDEMEAVALPQLYGGTFQQFAVRKVSLSNDLADWASKIDENTRFVYGELPSNPGLAHSRGVPVIIDATVATPVLMRPIALGADIVIQSVSKTMTSSGFGIAGAVISRKNIVSKYLPQEAKDDFCTYLKLLPNRDNGPTNSPMYLFDSEHDDQYGKPVNRYGHLLSFCVKGGHQNTRDVFNAFQMIWRATDLGRIKSVATIPAISTHSQQGEEGRKIANIPDNLIRLSIGAEHADQICISLETAHPAKFPLSLDGIEQKEEFFIKMSDDYS